MTKTCRKPKKNKKKKTIFQRSWNLGRLQKEFWNIVFFGSFGFFVFFQVLEFGVSPERVLKYCFFWFFCFFGFFQVLEFGVTQERVLKYCFFGSFVFFWFFQVLEFGVTQERVLKYYFLLVFCRFFCFLRACPRTSRILFSWFLCWFSAGFLKIVISSLCFLSCPWLSPKIPNVFFICFTRVWCLARKNIPTFPLPFSSLFYWIPYFSLLFSIEFPTYSLLVYWNLCFVCTFLLKSLLSLIVYWNLHFYTEISTFLFSFLLNSLLSLYLLIGISTCSLLFYWKLCFLCTFLLKSLLSLLVYWNLHFSSTFLLKSQLFSSFFYWILYFSLLFSIEFPTYSLHVYWNLYLPFTFLLKSILSLY